MRRAPLAVHLVLATPLLAHSIGPAIALWLLAPLAFFSLSCWSDVLSGAISEGLGTQGWAMSVAANVVGYIAGIFAAGLLGPLVILPTLWIVSSLVLAAWQRVDPARVILAKIPSLLVSGIVSGIVLLFVLAASIG
jgi:hypothetical protein